MSAALQLAEQSQVTRIVENGVDVVVVSRDGGTRITAKADVGGTDFESRTIGPGGVDVVNVHTQDFIIPTELLVDGVTPVTVDTGWTIEHAGLLFEVLPISGEQPVRDSGRYGLLKRIHTKEIGTL
jgi:hypothetical protein